MVFIIACIYTNSGLIYSSTQLDLLKGVGLVMMQTRSDGQIHGRMAEVGWRVGAGAGAAIPRAAIPLDTSFNGIRYLFTHPNGSLSAHICI
jgi:hypothetical protein